MLSAVIRLAGTPLRVNPKVRTAAWSVPSSTVTWRISAGVSRRCRNVDANPALPRLCALSFRASMRAGRPIEARQPVTSASAIVRAPPLMPGTPIKIQPLGSAAPRNPCTATAPRRIASARLARATASPARRCCRPGVREVAAKRSAGGKNPKPVATASADDPGSASGRTVGAAAAGRNGPVSRVPPSHAVLAGDPHAPSAHPFSKEVWLFEGGLAKKA